MMGSAVLFAAWSDRPYGFQLASQVAYTPAVILYTFSRNRGMQRYLFSCHFVRPQLPRLAFRHLGFIAVLFLLQTAAFQLRPRLSPSWFLASGFKDTNRFEATFGALCVALVFTEVVLNRSSLKRAHSDYNLDRAA